MWPSPADSAASKKWLWQQAQAYRADDGLQLQTISTEEFDGLLNQLIRGRAAVFTGAGVEPPLFVPDSLVDSELVSALVQDVSCWDHLCFGWAARLRHAMVSMRSIRQCWLSKTWLLLMPLSSNLAMLQLCKGSHLLSTLHTSLDNFWTGGRYNCMAIQHKLGNICLSQSKCVSSGYRVNYLSKQTRVAVRREAGRPVAVLKPKPVCVQGNPYAPFSQALSLLVRHLPLFTLNFSHHLEQAVRSGGNAQSRRIPLNFIDYCSRAGKLQPCTPWASFSAYVHEMLVLCCSRGLYPWLRHLVLCCQHLMLAVHIFCLPAWSCPECYWVFSA